MAYIIRPLLTEKTLKQAETNNVYTFAIESKDKVSVDQVASAVAKQYKVKVVKATGLNRVGKIKRFGTARRPYRRADQRIVFLKLAAGDKIEDFNLNTNN
jgi:ribosomal protein L23